MISGGVHGKDVNIYTARAHWRRYTKVANAARVTAYMATHDAVLLVCRRLQIGEECQYVRWAKGEEQLL